MKKTDTQEDFSPFDPYVPENGADFYRWLLNVEVVSNIIRIDLRGYLRETEGDAKWRCTEKLVRNRVAARHMIRALTTINETAALAGEVVNPDHIKSALWKIHRIRKENLKKLQAEKEDKQ